MWKIGLVVLLAALGGPVAAAGQSAGMVGPFDTVVTPPGAWKKAADAYERGDCATVLKLLGPRLKRGAGRHAPEELLAVGYGAAANCADRMNRHALADRYAIAGRRSRLALAAAAQAPARAKAPVRVK
jgi:hypothetical protein